MEQFFTDDDLFGLLEELEKEDAEIAYHIYSAILKDYCGYTLMTDESGKTFISKDGIALATMTADFKDAHCVVVTFN